MNGGQILEVDLPIYSVHFGGQPASPVLTHNNVDRFSHLYFEQTLEHCWLALPSGLPLWSI